VAILQLLWGKVKNPAASCGASSKEKANMGAAAPKPPLAIHPHSKLRGIPAFSHKHINRRSGLVIMEEGDCRFSC
jgi:hypothetical protein